MKKVFFIGLNKTGTSSLHEAMKILGYNSVHAKTKTGINIKEKIEDNYNKGKDILDGLKDYNAFSDWDKDQSSHYIFKEFYNQYPDSKFILNTRELLPWLNSREKHVERNIEKKKQNPNKNMTWLTIDIQNWEKHYIRHHDAVMKFFSDKKEKLLILDVTKNEGWDSLCQFLGCDVPKQPFPKRNVKPNLIRKIFRKIKTLHKR